MTVQEIKAKIPEAEVYELSPDAKYIICVKNNALSVIGMESFRQSLVAAGIKALLVVHHHNVDALRLLEVKD